MTKIPGMSSTAKSDTLETIKTILRRDLKLGPDAVIADDKPFFGGDVDLDSLDMLLLVTSIEKQFKFKIPSEDVGRKVFETPLTLATYIDEHLAVGGAAPAVAAGGGVTTVAPDYLSRLPHAEPFRFVSRVVRVSQYQDGQGAWDVRGDEPFFAGHFPGNPIVPGVLIAEALAQISGIVGHSGPGTKLAHVDIKFEQAARPPAEIVLKSRLIRTIGSNEMFEVEAAVAGTTVARGTITLTHA